MKKVNVHTTLWVRASGFEWHVPHKVVWTLTFYDQKRRKIRTTTDCLTPVLTISQKAKRKKTDTKSHEINGNTVIHELFINHCISIYFVILTDEFAILIVWTTTGNKFFAALCFSSTVVGLGTTFQRKNKQALEH
jgi:hypothetical protein